jgi:hypothetical protein
LLTSTPAAVGHLDPTVGAMVISIWPRWLSPSMLWFTTSYTSGSRVSAEPI